MTCFFMIYEKTSHIFIFLGFSGFDIKINFMHVGSNPTNSNSIYGRVVEGTGLIIHFRKDVAGSNPARCIFIT